MTALKTRKNMQWEKAQQRINVSPLVSRISRLVPQGKAAAVGLAFGESLFLRKLLMPVLVPLKLWVALQLVLLSKPGKGGTEEKGNPSETDTSTTLTCDELSLHRRR